MSAFIIIGGTRYNNLKSVSFEPQYDPRMESLPVNEFTAEIVTETDIEGTSADLYHTVIQDVANTWTQDEQCLAYNYQITKNERTGKDTIKIRAQSWVYILDKRILPAKMYRGTAIAEFMNDVFDGATVNDVYNSISCDYTYSTPPQNVTMYCPQQTARERLLWYCLAYGKRVIQWGNYDSLNGEQSLYSIRIVDHYNSVAVPRRIAYDDTFYKPSVKKVSSNSTLELYEYVSSTQTEKQGEVWRRCVVVEPGETESGLETDGEVWYVKVRMQQFKRSASAFKDDTATIKDGLYVYNPSSVYTVPWFYDYEVELDALWSMRVPMSQRDLYFMPGDTVEFYVDDETMCKGIIKSTSFIFGKRERLHMVIVTDLEPLTVYTAIVRYMYNGAQLGHYGPTHPDRPYALQLPDITVKTANGDMVFEPTQYSSKYIYADSNTDVTIQYRLK